jgi:AmmeMemoRadiSam system protein A
MNQYVLLAKKATENYVKEGKIIEPAKDLPEKFLIKKAGTFVTIEKNGNLRGAPRGERKRALRGCIGTYLPTKENIAQEIIYNAIAAASEDYRFGPIQPEELPFLSYTVYILGKPKSIKNIKELNPKKYGIIVKSGNKSGLLLPDLEGINTAEQQISIACAKAGIDPQNEKITIYKFTTEKYAEKEN